MKELTLISANLYLAPSAPPDGGEMRPMVETILVLSEPKYTFDDTGGTVRARVTETVRFNAAPVGLRELARRLTETADMADALAARVAAKVPPDEKAPRPKAKRQRTEPEATIRKAINGHTLVGEKWGGRWTLVCSTWPDLAAQHAGCEDASDCITEFERRATAPAANDAKEIA